MRLLPGITLIPILHGRAAFAGQVRNLCINNRYDCVAVDLPECFSQDLQHSVDDLPLLSAVVAEGIEDPVYYIPTDPCDPAIEGIRQANQNRLRCWFVGFPILRPQRPMPPMPDDFALKRLGFEEYSSLCLRVWGNPGEGSEEDQASQYIAFKLHELRAENRNILALVHMRHFVRVIHHFNREETCNLRFNDPPSYGTNVFMINPDHLYFALGELPFVTGKFEKERHDLFTGPVDSIEIIKDLFRETRDHCFDNRDDTSSLSPARIQSALTFVRNLTLMDGRFIPSLFDVIAAAKGVGGNSYAVRILKNAKYYPYLPYEHDSSFISVGIDEVILPDSGSPRRAVNLLRDTKMYWRSIKIKPDPSDYKKKKYRFAWNPFSMCSHVPEDRRIESFNAYIRSKALRIMCEDFVKTEPFMTSIKDGIDIRETLRNWYTGDIYVREIPPSRGALDTVVIIFDDDHDDRYPHRATWYAEHDEESTLSFYATSPFEDMIGPGIARAVYGGLSLLFPPRIIPNIFELTEHAEFKKLSHSLTYGAMLFSRERSIAYISNKRPDIHLKMASDRLHKHLVWIPINHFSSETLRRLRRFHVLNGKLVRSWASRFIGD